MARHTLWFCNLLLFQYYNLKNNKNNKYPLFIYLQYYLQDIISNKNLQRINVHHDYRGGYFLIYRLIIEI